MGYYLSGGTREEVYQRDRWRCAYCGKTQQQHQRETEQNDRLHIHHIWPRSARVENKRRNLLTLCRGCHAQLEPKIRRITNQYPEPEARVRVRWETVKRVRTGHPLSTPWTKAAMIRYRQTVGQSPTTV